MKMKAMILGACALSLTMGFAAQQGTIEGTVYKMNVGTGNTVTMNADDVAALGTGTGDVTELQKTGDGTLIIVTMPNFAGTIRISGGVYQVNGAVGAPFGTTSGKTIVEDGGTLLFTGVKGATTDYFPVFNEPFEVEGRGFNEQGAICVAAENNHINNRVAVMNMTLTGDTLVTGPKINDGDRGGANNSNYLYFNTNCKFDMGGFTLETCCTGNMEFRGTTITHPGHFISNGSGQFYIHNTTAFNHGPEHKIYLRTAGALSFYQNPLTNPFNWTVVCEGSDSAATTTLYFNRSATFDGNIEIAEGKTCYVQAGSVKVTITGNVTGKGSLNTNSPDLYLAGNNAFEGTLSGGTVFIASPTAIPDFAKCSSGVGGVKLTSSDKGIGLTSAQFSAFLAGAGATWRDGNYEKGFVVDEGDVVEIAEDYTTWPQNAIYNRSNGTVCFTKTVDSTRDMNFYHTGTKGGFRFSNPDEGTSKIGKWTLRQGRMEMFGAAIAKSNNTFVCQGQVDAPTYLVLSNTTFYGSHGDVTKKLGPFLMGDGSADDTIEVLKDSDVRNSLTMGYRSGTSSGFYLRDGFFNLMKNYNADCAIGESGTGYFEQSGGNCEILNHCQLGHYPGSFGLHYMTGGDCKVTGATYNIGQSGNAVFYQCGGSFSTPYLFYIGSSAYDASAGQAKAQYIQHTWTLTGEGTTGECTGSIRMSERNNTEDTINLNNGAKLTTSWIYRSRAYYDNNKGILPTGGFYSNDCAYVNFNGGTLRVTANNFLGCDKAFDGRGTTSNRVRPIIYEGGATIEIVGYLSLATPLEDAIGKGVAAIPMPEDAVTTGRNAPPFVKIVGDGTNATAIATFDSKTQTWTGIAVTSPGFGYTWAKAQFFIHGAKTYEVDCTLADNAVGPVHFVIDKKAYSTAELNFTCAQTYKGPTRISGGRVWFNGGSIASRDITIDADANLCTAACINGANVHGSGDTYYNWHTANFTADAQAAGIRQQSNTLTIDANPVFTITNLAKTGDVVDNQSVTVLRKGNGPIAGTDNLANATFVGVPEGYRARARFRDGNVIVKVYKPSGFTVIIQ